MSTTVSQTNQDEKDWPPILLWGVCSGMIAVTLILDLQLPLGIASAVPYTLAVLVAAFIKPPRVLWSVAFCTSFLTLVGMVYSPRTSEVSSWQTFSNRGLAIFSIWMVAIIMNQRNIFQTKKQKAQARIRVLEGLLPICAECKMIRDSSNSWHRLEAYITSHSEAKFTHGMCPDCSERSLNQYFQMHPQKTSRP